MAQLDATAPPARWTAAQTRTQLAAVAWLRWRIFLNAFQRNAKKRSAAGLVMVILLRIVLWGFAALLAIGPIVGCGLSAYYRPDSLFAVLWAVFGIYLFVGVNIASTPLNFDLTPLLRFPVAFPSYLLMRLTFAFFTIPTIIANLALLSCATGLALARPRLLPWTVLVLAVFGLSNLVMLRMVLAWMERWMGTKRAREILGGMVLVVSLSMQLLVTSSGRGVFRHFGGAASRLSWLAPLQRIMPPTLAADSIAQFAAHRVGPAALSLLALGLSVAIFLCLFALRLRAEYRGENLSETGPRAQRRTTRAATQARPEPQHTSPATFHTPDTVAACAWKEWVYLKRSGAQFYGLVTPLFFVLILSRRNGLFGNTAMLLPYAVSYTLFGLLARFYNVFGADGPGYNLYLMAPVRLRDVILGKNTVSAALLLVELAATLAAVYFIAAGRIQAPIVVATLMWVVFALFTNLAVGNLRSIYAPIRFEQGKAMRPKGTRPSGVATLVTLVGSLALCIPTILLCKNLGHVWVATAIFAALAAAALTVYLIVLSRYDTLAEKRRDSMLEALIRT